ncbi:hypothetical protein D3C74_439120 [compost metagenome]
MLPIMRAMRFIYEQWHASNVAYLGNGRQISAHTVVIGQSDKYALCLRIGLDSSLNRLNRRHDRKSRRWIDPRLQKYSSCAG